MKRVVVFAHYDKDKIIDDYVLYYLKALKDVVDDIIFVSCQNILNKEKIQNIVSNIIDEEHDEYDFGSYKRGYLYLKNNDLLKNYDELIFVNDSCYGPFHPLENIFSEMENNRKCDFWGITKNIFGIEKIKNKYLLTKRIHLQSYFLCFYKNVFLSDVFYNFIVSIKHENVKKDIIINYEIGLSELLIKNNFIFDSYNTNYIKFNNAIYYFWRQLIEKHNIPFVKCSILRLKNRNLTTTINWQNVIKKHSDYPVEIIEKNLLRTTEKKEKLFNKIPFFSVNYYFFKSLVIKRIKLFFVFINNKYAYFCKKYNL